jgi:hypothetical protein
MNQFEKLGAFYLGRIYDLKTKQTRDDMVLYDAKDLTTHAVCVGMTGSGKTGLCVGLLEEAAIDNIPAIALDVKGDLGNLLLTFPDLRPSDFRPWIDEDEATRKGFAPDEYATRVAQTWKKGLAEWGQDGERIARFRNAADMAIYTPGSTSGLPLTVLRSFAAPPRALIEDADALRDRVLAATSGLLTLLAIDPDPIRSREHILLSNILHHAWSEGRDMDISGLIREIQSPPFATIGVFDLESFFPARDRFNLAMTLNNLLASPGFAAWLQGEPMDIGRLLHTPEGRPRISIISIAHLSDGERMFFVTLLLNEVVAWMRTQPGTSSLRAILYMDEIFGYFPPTAAPPSKTPMLTLLKQARAFGLGVVLATQNPVDLDYKGLSNAGTWFIGRLQTERDKARVLEGLETASAGAGHLFARRNMDDILSSLGSRVFLLHNVHEDEPVLFQTRWCLSYLRGPLTRQHFQILMESRQPALDQPVSGPTAGEPAVMVPRPIPTTGVSADRPMVPSDIPQFFLLLKEPVLGDGGLVYRPSLVANARLHFVSASAGVDIWDEVAFLLPLSEGAVDIPWDEATVLHEGEPEMTKEPEPQARFEPLPSAAMQKASYTGWRKSLAAYLYQNQTLTLWKCPTLKLNSTPHESEGDFRIRLTQTVHEKRDVEVEKLRKRYAPQLAKLQDRIRKAEARVGREESQYKGQKMQTAISVGATVLGALFGRKMGGLGSIGRATTAMRGVGRAAREKEDISRALEDVEALRQELAQLEDEFQEATERLQDTYDPDRFDLKDLNIRPRKSDISVKTLVLAWTPWRDAGQGDAQPVF